MRLSAVISTNSFVVAAICVVLGVVTSPAAGQSAPAPEGEEVPEGAAPEEVPAEPGPEGAAPEEVPAEPVAQEAEPPPHVEPSPEAAVSAPAPEVDAPPVVEASTEPERAYMTTDPAHAPWRGSLLSLRTGAGVTSFDPGADLTYNPQVGLAFAGQLRWWLLDALYVQASLGLSRELTRSDSTTYANETLLGDLAFRVAAPGLLTIPWVEIEISPALTVRTPTSKASAGRTMHAAIGLELAISRDFDLLEGLSFTYESAATRFLHAYTTGALDSPRIATCVGAAGECDAYLNNGVRNVEWQLTNVAAASLQALTWLGVSTHVAWVSHQVYASKVDTATVSYLPQVPTRWRHYLIFGFEVALTPIPWLTTAVGVSTQAPQLAPDSKPYTPLFNRYTTLQADIRLNVARLIDALVPDDSPDDEEIE
jgi:hypothetical protein